MASSEQRKKLAAGWQRFTSDLQARAAETDLNAKFAWDDAAIEEEKGLEDNAVSDEGAEVDIANELKDVGTDAKSASTMFPKRPRAFAVGYNPNSRTLYVIFRDNTWYEYRNVPTDIWLGLKGAESTGRYLRDSGLDKWEDRGEANLTGMSAGFAARLASAAASASRIQKGGIGLI